MEYRLKLLMTTANNVDTAGCKLLWDSSDCSFVGFESTNIFSTADVVSIDGTSCGITLNDSTAKTGDLHLATLIFNIASESNINFAIENQVASCQGQIVNSRWIAEPWAYDIAEFRFTWE